MSAPKCTDEEFIAAWRELASATKVAQRFKMNARQVSTRRRRIEARYEIELKTFDPRQAYNDFKPPVDGAAIMSETLQDGIIIVGSDAHVWPDKMTTCQRAFLHFIKKLRPSVVILNGDVVDGARISRHPRIGWENRPTVKQELDAVTEYLTLVEKACGGARRFWPLGNHDMRFEMMLASQVPEMEGIEGFHLKDRFPNWTPCWRVDFNGNLTVKHRWHNGLHATYNNTLRSGWSIVTGHLHSAQARPWTDLNGTRYGVDGGCLADPYDDQFIHYTEANSVNWRSAFVVLTLRNGRLLMPEFVMKHAEGQVEFRGEIVTI